MSVANPRKAMAALIPAAITTPHGVAVRPLTLGMYALLERIGSPMLTGAVVPVLDMLPTLYLLAHDPRESLGLLDELPALAVAWADTLPPDAVGGIEEAARRQVAAMLDVIAAEPRGKKKTGTTDGSPPSSSGRPRPTTGGSTTSSGARPPAP